MDEKISKDFGISADEKLGLKQLFFRINKDVLWEAVKHMCDSHAIPSKERLSRYFEELFCRNIDKDYIQKRRHLGVLHERSGIKPMLYIMAFSRWLAFLFPRIKEICSSELLFFLFKNILLDIALCIESYEQLHEERYKKMFDSIGYAIVSVDLETKQIVMANEKAEQLLETPKETLIKKSFSELIDIALEELVSVGEKRAFLKAKEQIPVVVNCWECESGGMKYLVCLIRDIRREVKADKEIRSLTRLYDALSSINQLITTADDEKVLFEKACSILKQKAGFKYVAITEKGKEKPLVEKGKRTDQDSALCVLFKNARDEYVLNVVISKDMDLAYKEKLLLEEVAFDLGFALNNIEKRRKLSHIAYYDKLTHLPNRMYFNQRLREMVSRSRTEGSKVAVAIMIIDKFTEMELSLGSHFADELIKSVASRIRDRVRERDLVARIEQDRFAIAVESTNPRPIIKNLVERVRSAIKDTIYINGSGLDVTFSFGVAIFPYDAESAEELLLNAVVSAERSQEMGGDKLVFYSEQLTKKIKDRISIRRALRGALEKREFCLYYQPKIDLKTGTIAGAEALIRWIKDGQIIPPYKFIPILEESELIQEVGKWVIKEACTHMKEWAKRDIRLNIAVNISPIQLSSPSFMEELISSISMCGTVTSMLEVEITESAIMGDIARSIAFLNRLLDMGVKSYIDDFGTGYSSLAYLKKLPVYAIKIDREFVKDIPDSKEDIEIIRATVSMAKTYGMKTVAEGSETAEQVRILRELGCDYVQGYYFCEPVPPDEFIEYVLNFSGDIP